MAQVFDIVLVYQFIKRLTTPFDETEAFKLGLIDKKGKRLKKASSSEEKKAMTYFDRLIFNLKRLLAKVPGGETKFGTYAAALFLLKESASPKENYSEEELAEALLENMEMLEEGKTLKTLFEDAPANATGAAVAGTGDDKVHWRPDGRKKEMKAFLRRYTEQKGKREARKKRKDFMKQLGIDV
jgi:hypothetical protein